MHEICIIGDKDSILGFKALGYSIYSVDDAYEAERILEKVSKKYAIIFIVEQFAVEIKGAINKYRESKLPAIVSLPGSRGSLGSGLAIIRDAMERAVGADILFKEE